MSNWSTAQIICLKKTNEQNFTFVDDKQVKIVLNN